MIYLSLGSNIGDREKHLREAQDNLYEFISNPAASSIYETDPVDYLDQGAFLNMVISGETNLDPFELLNRINDIEIKLGRTRLISKGPRTIDIDILLYNNKIIQTSDLVIPHASMNKRKFVLVPLLELNPDLTDPASSVFYSKYIKNLEEQGIYYYS